MAVEDFRKYLTSTYSSSDLKERFGLTDVRYVTAPRMESAPAKLNDPLLQAWTEFRCQQLTCYYAEMSSFIRSIKSSVAVDNNPSSGISGDRIIWEQGVDYPRLLSEVDAAWSEEGNTATVTEEGILVSKIRTFKAAARLNRRIFCYTWGADSNWGYQENTGSLLQMAESMAYNRQCLGMVGIVNAIPDLPSEPRQYIRFFHENFDLYRGITSIADVALFYSFSSMGFNEDRPTKSFMLAAQTLIQGRLLFDILFDQQLENISKYRVLLLADQECLSDRQLQIVRNFVNQGGGLVVTEHSSLYTERKERRRDFGLKDCLGVSALPWKGPASPESILPGGPVQTQMGQGKVVYIPEIILAEVKMSFPNKNKRQHLWPLPANSQILHDAVKTVMKGNCTVQTSAIASPYVTVELVSQKSGERMVLHLLNYDYVRTPSMKDLQISISIPAGKQVAHIRTLSPDENGREQQLRWSTAETVTFTVPSLRIYTVVVLDLV
jgi:hypothetical protein